MTHHLPRLALCAALAGAAFLPATAQAWWHGGFFVGVPPVVVGPPLAAYPYPYYYPPPYPYAPGYYPPGYQYAPPASTSAPQSVAPAQPQMSQATPYGNTCYAGIYTCGAAPRSHVGSVCSCPGIGAPSYGSVQ